MLVIRTKHFWLGSAPARRSGHGIMRVQLLMAQSAERELGMAWLWPERLDIEVPAAVCSAATMGALGRIPVETRIAPKSENWQLSPHRRGVGELCASIRRVFSSSSPGRHRRALTTRLGLLQPARQRSTAVHESSWRPMGMPTAAGRAAKHSMRDVRRSEDFKLGDRSVRKNIAPCAIDLGPERRHGDGA